MSPAELWQGGPVQLESVPCDLCGSTESRIEVQASDNMGFVPGRFTVVRCTNCGLAYQNPRPRPDEITRIYPETYGPHLDMRSPDELPPLVKWGRKVERAAASSYYRQCARPSGARPELCLPSFWSLLANALQLVVLPPIGAGAQQAPRLLDVGCGTGRFLARMKREGWEIDGVELNRAAAERARALLGTPVVVGAFGPGQFHAGSFDLVTMWHVLEHLDRPQESLGEVARLLKPGGWLVAQVPNLDSMEVRLTRDKASLLDLPRHFYHFEPATLSSAVRKAGLSVVRLVFPIEPTTLYTSLARKLGRLRGLGPIRGHIWRRRLLWPLCAVLSWSGMSGQMAVIARKPEGIG